MECCFIVRTFHTKKILIGVMRIKLNKLCFTLTKSTVMYSKYCINRFLFPSAVNAIDVRIHACGYAICKNFFQT